MERAVAARLIRLPVLTAAIGAARSSTPRTSSDIVNRLFIPRSGRDGWWALSARGVEGLVAGKAADRSAQREAGSLCPGGREGQPDSVEVGLRDHGKPQRARHSLA